MISFGNQNQQQLQNFQPQMDKNNSYGQGVGVNGYNYKLPSETVSTPMFDLNTFNSEPAGAALEYAFIDSPIVATPRHEFPWQYH